MSFDVCYLTVGTISMDIYIYIVHPVTMPRILELLQIVEERSNISGIKTNISMLNSFPAYEPQIQQMIIPSFLLTSLYLLPPGLLWCLSGASIFLFQPFLQMKSRIYMLLSCIPALENFLMDYDDVL
jgi:hypothetical protein